MLSDLSPGDKLSLKGKIFELQKTLQIIDIRNKQKEEFSYKPTLYNYDLPDRDNNVLDSINKAEIIRKQKKEMLRAAVLLQSEEGCTFAPVLVSKSRHAPKNDKRPVHMRLTERGKISNESMEQLRDRMGKYDSQGNRLFTPSINQNNGVPRSVNHSFTSTSSVPNSRPLPSPTASVDGSTAAADEFLYQDARDREERCRMREREQQAQIKSKATASKINSASIVLLRRKAERDARAAFRVLVGKDGDDSCEGDFLGIDDVQHFAYSELGSLGKWTEDSLARHTALLWSLLDSQQTGRLSQKEFSQLAVPFLLHNTPTTALQDIHTTDVSTALAASAPEELAQLQSFLRKVVVRSQSPRVVQPTTTSFAPHIYQHSYKLASKREKREREQIEQILAQQYRSDEVSVTTAVSGTVQGSDNNNSDNSNNNNNTHSNTEQHESSQYCDGGEDLPPPPPPSHTIDTNHHTNNNNNNTNTTTNTNTNNTTHTNNTTNTIPAAVHMSRHDLMYARALIKEQNLQRKAIEVAAREMQECTFHPKIIPPMPLHTKPTLTTTTQPTLTTHTTSDVHSTGEVGVSDRVGSSNTNNSTTQNIDESLVESDQNSTNTSVNRGSNSNKNTIHERLYSLKDKQRTTKLTEPSPRIIAEMQACTFTPHLQTSFYRKGELNTIPQMPTEKSQQGITNSIQRIRTANNNKVQHTMKEDHEYKRTQLNNSYIRSREVARQGIVPFRFVLGERHEQREMTSPVKRGDPDLIVDVKLSAMKTGKISIWRGDDPYDLASSFARIYSLDSKARDLLVNVIYQSMESNGLLVRGEEGEGVYSPELDFPDIQTDREYISSGYGTSGVSNGVSNSVDNVESHLLHTGSGTQDDHSQSSVSDSDESDISVEQSLDSGSEGEGSDRDSENLTA